jgi:hypothetical protein
MSALPTRKTSSRIPAGPIAKVTKAATAPAATTPKIKLHDVAHKANWASMFEWLGTQLKARAEEGGLSFTVTQAVWMREDLDLHEVLSYLIDHISECMTQTHDAFPEPLATYIADLPDEMHVTWQFTSLQAWAIVFRWEAPESLVRPELVAIAREVGGFAEAEATVFARSVQRRQPPLSPKSQETTVRTLAASVARAQHEAMWQQVRGNTRGGTLASLSFPPFTPQLPLRYRGLLRITASFPMMIPVSCGGSGEKRKRTSRAGVVSVAHVRHARAIVCAFTPLNEMRDWIKERVEQHKLAAVHPNDHTLVVPDTIWQRKELGLYEALYGIANAVAAGKWHGGTEQLTIEPLTAFLAEHKLEMRYTIEPPDAAAATAANPIADDESKKENADSVAPRWVITFSW